MKKLLIVLGSSALVVLILIAVVYSRFSTLAEKHLAKQLLADAREVVQEKKIEVMPYPDKYTEVPLPYYYWFDFGFDDDFQVKLDGVKDPFDFRVGQPTPKLGNEIPGNRLYMKSLVGKQIKVTIFLRPKKETEK